MCLIYLHLYKDTYLILMQAYKGLPYLLHYSENPMKKQIYFPKLEVFTISKNRYRFKECNSQNEAYFYKWSFR